MKKTLALLAATTALTATLGLPVFSAMLGPQQSGQGTTAAIFAHDDALPLILIDSDDDEDEDEDDDDEDDDCDDDDEDGCRNGRNPAPAGSVAPPANGLFGNGAPPKVQVN